MLASLGLGTRLLYGAYLVVSGKVKDLYPEVAAADPSFIITAQLEMPLDILSGLLLIFWPFYLVWLKERRA
jgi:hypothetical protein